MKHICRAFNTCIYQYFTIYRAFNTCIYQYFTIYRAFNTCIYQYFTIYRAFNTCIYQYFTIYRAFNTCIYQYFTIYRLYILLKFEHFSWISFTTLSEIRRYQLPFKWVKVPGTAHYWKACIIMCIKFLTSCGTIALMVLDQFSDFLQIIRTMVGK